MMDISDGTETKETYKHYIGHWVNISEIVRQSSGHRVGKHVFEGMSSHEGMSRWRSSPHG